MKSLLLVAALALGLTACGSGSEVCSSGETFCKDAPASPAPCDQYHATSVQTETKSDGATVTIMECKR